MMLMMTDYKPIVAIGIVIWGWTHALKLLIDEIRIINRLIERLDIPEYLKRNVTYWLAGSVVDLALFLLLA